MEELKAIARISAVGGSEFTAVLRDPGSDVHRNSGGISPGHPGSYLSVVDGDLRVLARVHRIFEGEAGTATTNPGKRRCLSLLPLGEMDAQGGFQRGVTRYPGFNAEVYPVTAQEMALIFGTHDATALTLGNLPAMPEVAVYLDPTRLFSRHLAVLGQSGAGKTWGVTSMIQKTVALLPKSHIVLLDLHGEYCWRDQTATLQSAFPETMLRYIDATDLEIPYWLLSFAELVDLFVDRSDPNVSTQIAFLRETVQQLKQEANKDLGLANISIDSPVYFSLAKLYLYFKEANSKMYDFGKREGPLFGQFDEFLIRLQSRMNDVRYRFLLKPQRRQDSASLVDLLRDFVGLDGQGKQVTVIDLSSVPHDVLPTVTAQIGRLAFEFNYWNPRYREFPLLLVCEEAHAYIPRGERTQYSNTRRSMERIAKEGRKYGVALVVISQRPHELSETVLSQCANYFCFRITNPEDQEYVRALVPEGERNLADTLSSLGRGEALTLGEAVPIPLRFLFLPPDPTPNSADIDFTTHWQGGPDDVDVAGIVDQWRRQQRLKH